MSIPYSAGSLYATTQDLLQWEKALFGRKILSDNSLKKMIKPFKDNYGLGVEIHTLNGHKAITHTGNTSGFDTQLIYCPENKLTAVILANLNTVERVARTILLKLVSLVLEK